MKAIWEKFKYIRKHKKIQMFGVSVGVIGVLILLDLFSISVHRENVNQDILSNVAIYSESFVSSLSQTEGTVQAVFVNKDRTRAAIMINIPAITQMSTDAADYKIFVKGYNISKQDYAVATLNKPNGGFYIFGTTGYEMIYLVDNAGWKDQAIELVVRCYKTLVDNSQGANFAGLDVSYSQYDQYRIVVNPAANDCTVVDFLDGEELGSDSVVSLYKRCVIDAQEDDMRAQLYRDVKDLNTYMERIGSYAHNLEQDRVNVKGVPSSILNDKFINQDDGEGNEKFYHIVSDKYAINTNMNAESSLVYKPDYIFEGGVDFDWFNYNLNDTSYLAQLTEGTGLQNRAYLDNLGVRYQQAGRIETLSLNGWRQIDGTEINVEAYRTSKLTELNKIAIDISEYVNAVNGYIALKRQYQCIDLPQYLYVEYNMLSSSTTFTANYTEDTIHVW